MIRFSSILFPAHSALWDLIFAPSLIILFFCSHFFFFFFYVPDYNFPFYVQLQAKVYFKET